MMRSEGGKIALIFISHTQEIKKYNRDSFTPTLLRFYLNMEAAGWFNGNRIRIQFFPNILHSRAYCDKRQAELELSS